MLRDTFDLLRETRRLSWVLGPRKGFQVANGLRGRNGEVRVDFPGMPGPLFVRGGTSDVDVFRDVFEVRSFDIDLGGEPRVIVDAGAYTGLTTAFFAQRFPNARVIAIEPDASNHEVLLRNTKGFGNVRVLHAALWHEGGVEVPIGCVPERSWASRVGAAAATVNMVPTVTVPALLEQEGAIDLLKLDVEGSERPLFEHEVESGGWVDRIKWILAELHDHCAPGCSAAFYRAISRHRFSQSLHREKVLITIDAREP